MYAYANNIFFPMSMRSRYEETASWPSEYVEVDENTFVEYSQTPPDGKQRGTNDNGYPEWVDLPKPTAEQYVKMAENEKSTKINIANTTINDNFWPSKLMLGRLNDNDKSLFDKWLDYIDAVNAVDTSKAPDIKWPQPPED